MEKERLQQEADRRKKEEEDRLAQQAADESKKAQDEAEAKAQAGAMNAMFEATAAVGDASVPKGKEEYVIAVLHQQAYAEMFAMWFTKEGYKPLLMDQLEKVTLKKSATTLRIWLPKPVRSWKANLSARKRSSKPLWPPITMIKDPYYSEPEVSNSDLSWLKNQFASF